MGFFASFAGLQVTSARVFLPPWGVPTADVELPDPAALPARGTLTIGDASYSMATVRAPPGGFAGAQSARLVGGAGGWRGPLGARAYRAAGGVKLSTVVGDAAAEAGELVTVPADVERLLGSFWMRPAGPASRTLRQLLGQAWHVEPSGVTVAEPWAAAPVTVPYTVRWYDTGRGVALILSDSLAPWRPGAVFQAPTFTGTRTASSVSLWMPGEGQIEIEVMV